VVRKRGLEPLRYCYRQPLKVGCREVTRGITESFRALVSRERSLEVGGFQKFAVKFTVSVSWCRYASAETTVPASCSADPITIRRNPCLVLVLRRSMLAISCSSSNPFSIWRNSQGTDKLPCCPTSGGALR
jgi:hypothetical protein